MQQTIAWLGHQIDIKSVTLSNLLISMFLTLTPGTVSSFAMSAQTVVVSSIVLVDAIWTRVFAKASLRLGGCLSHNWGFKVQSLCHISFRASGHQDVSRSWGRVSD